MKPIVQEERTGCGIASVATVAGLSYRRVQRVANRLGIFAEDQRLWSETGYVRRLLRQFGIRAAGTEARFASWRTLPHLALLAIKWRRVRDRSFWHWVVFWRGPNGAVVLDPKRELQTNRRRDFSRMRPKWFIAITKATR
jgi:ABC-type bacteriocin/lantibiotic exporter with double-glycine peptidase domain